jgi:hypothetical protein
MEKQKEKDTYSYRGWLISDNFLKRAFAILGYYSVASLIISFILLLLLFIFMFFGMMIGFMIKPF